MHVHVRAGQSQMQDNRDLISHRVILQAKAAS